MSRARDSAKKFPCAPQMEADIVVAVAQDSRVDLLAKWMGVLIRGGHARSERQPMLS